MVTRNEVYTEWLKKKKEKKGDDRYLKSGSLELEQWKDG